MLKNWIKSILLFIRTWFRLMNKDVNGKTYSLRERLSFYLLGILSSLVICVLIPNGFSESFIDYIKDVFSIFVGFFITVLVFAYDKLLLIKMPSKEEIDKMDADKRPNSQYELWVKRQNNYTIKFFYGLGFNIFSSGVVLSLLMLNVIFPKFFNINLDDFILIKSFHELTLTSIFYALYAMIIFMIRWIVIYLIGSVFVYTIYSVTSLIQVLKKKNKHTLCK